MVEIREETGGQRPPRADSLREQVKFLAQDSQNIVFTDHAMDRMEERDISTTMVLKVLRTGEVKGDVEQGRKPSDWTVKMATRILGNRDVGVVTAVLKAGKLIIITTEWEDLR